jgi:ATP-dependent DNA ligase
LFAFDRPIEERRAALSRVVASVDCILFSDALVAEGALVFAKACEMGLEGIVSKRAGSRYSSGNLRALCQRCHMLHDRPHHLAQRWVSYRRRSAVGDLFLGPYPALIASLTSKRRVRSSEP